MVFWEGSLHLEDEVPKCILLLPKNTEMFIPLFFWGPPFSLRMDCGLSSFFFKDGGGPRGPKKKGDASPFFFMDCVFRVLDLHRKLQTKKSSTEFSTSINPQEQICQSAPKERRRRCAEKQYSKRVFWEIPFFLCPLIKLRFATKTSEILEGATSRGPEKKRTLQKHPSGRPFLRTTPSPLLWRTPNLYLW